MVMHHKRGKVKMMWSSTDFFFHLCGGELVCYASKVTFILEVNMCASGGWVGQTPSGRDGGGNLIRVF